MNRTKRISLITAAAAIILLLASGLPAPAQPRQLPHHAIAVALDPVKHTLAATDTITLPAKFPRSFLFALHAGLSPRTNDRGVRITKEEPRPGEVALEIYRVTLPPDAGRLSVSYEGGIHHPVTTGRNQARGMDQTPGSISSEGIYLAGSSAWYPLLPADFVTFTLTIDLPAGWDAVSQGGRTAHQTAPAGTMKVGWDSPEPQNEIYLIAAPFTAYEKKGESISAQVYLRKPDQALADRYLDATLRYIAMYDGLIAPYPYKKFALVENFWETGFGMPSFTLLGPTVLRLPFIINTSYPHEILHNWWGNSVYPDYAKGNWSEGLTAYLSDHLLREQQGAGADYRLNTLQKYADYVLTGRDFPLTRFTSRHSPSTEAVGYGKSLMFFHMLRLELGDKTFVDGIRDFYRAFKFRYATFGDIEQSFEKTSGRKLGNEFAQWVARTGAPEIRLRNARTGGRDGKHAVAATLEQVQPGSFYRLRIPVAVTMEGQERAFQTVVHMTDRKQEFVLNVPFRPVRLDIDPEFDVFRRLDRGEIPPAITQVLGSEKVLAILPSKAPQEVLAAYRQFAQSFANAGPDKVDVALDRDVAKLPADRSIVVLGWENSFFEHTAQAWARYGAAATKNDVRIGKTMFPKAGHAVVLASRNPGNKETAILFVAADGPRALPGLARKLPHYHKYSYLVFEGGEPANVGKGRWPVVDSPLTVFFKDTHGRVSHADRAQLARREPLAALPPVYSKERMMETVGYLAGSGLRGRETGTPEIDKAAEYIARRFQQAGLAPGGDDNTYYQKWSAADRASKKQLQLRNVIGVIPGKKRETADQSVVAGAHYDHLGTGRRLGRAEDRGRIHPGADDNASGVAVLLELAAVMRERTPPDRSIVFAAFTGEEEGRLGSVYYVGNEKRYPASKCIGMVNLDTVGRLNGKKLLVLGGSSAGEWAHIFRGAGFATGVDVDMVAEELDASDQKSFQAAGVPAVQLFSGPNLDYHRPTDTADKIDASGLVAVASVAGEAIEYLADRAAPLTPTLKGGKPESAPTAERKVTLGTVPDYSYAGEGVRLSGVAEGSPAAGVGLRQGDVIVRINGTPLKGLKDFSDALKRLRPGDRVTLTFVRDGMERTVETEAKAR